MKNAYLRKVFAGISVFALVGLGLSPNVAMADSNPAPTNSPIALAPSDVKVGGKFLVNDVTWQQINLPSAAGPSFTTGVKYEAFPVLCEEDGCVEHSFNFRSHLRFENPHIVSFDSQSFLPELTQYTEEGIYAWTVFETKQGPDICIGACPPYWPSTLSKSVYVVRATVKKLGDDFTCDQVTIQKVKNDDGTPNGDYVDHIEFVNVLELTGTLDVTQKVANSVLVPELDSYAMQAVFEWPENFDGAVNAATGKWTTTIPEVKAADDSEASEINCKADAVKKRTVCDFSLAAGKVARFTGIPSGSQFAVTEKTTGNFTTDYADETGIIPTPVWVVPQSVATIGMHVDLSEATSEEDCSEDSDYAAAQRAAGRIITYDNWAMVNPRFEWNADEQTCEFKTDVADHSMNAEIQIHTVVTNTYYKVVSNTITDEDGNPVLVSDKDGNDMSNKPVDDGVSVEVAPSAQCKSDVDKGCVVVNPDGSVTVRDDENGKPPANVTVTATDTDGDGDIDEITVTNVVVLVPVYRLYYMGTGEHLFTTDANEYKV
ncbi:MAG: hypothetical protein IKZ87_04020, partial [Actinomycetaceae bacterium]|nr:hypothetical protein [Actinomycetaceae bacterium]